MRTWIVAVTMLVSVLAPTSVQAQTAGSGALCQQTIFNSTAPLLNYASRYSPNGQAPQGFAPLAQPFATSPIEGALYGYPAPAYYASYATPAFAQRQPNRYPAGYPQSSVYPGLYPQSGMPSGPGYPPNPALMSPIPEIASEIPAVEPNPELSSAAILEQLQRDGTLQQLTSTERANFLLQLASLQQTEIGQRIAQAGLQQNAQSNVINMRRVPYELSALYQSNSRDWFQSYVLYAQVVQNLLQATCNPSSGTPGNSGGTGLGDISSLSIFCRSNTLNLAVCSGFR